MQASSHYELACCFLPYFPGWSLPERFAFLYGSVEPDINCLTYLRGIPAGDGLHGHSDTQVLPRIDRLARLLGRQGQWHPLDCYRLGKLAHYVADAFTLPHNPNFSGDMRAHIRYEAQLAAYFHARLPDARPPHGLSGCVPPASPDGLPELLRWRHRLYLSAVPGVENDAFFILEAAQAVAMVFAPDGAPVPQPHGTGVLGGVFR